MRPCLVRGCGREVAAFFHFCKIHWALVPLWMKDEIAKAYATRQREPEVYAATLEGAQRLILEWENDDGA